MFKRTLGIALGLAIAVSAAADPIDHGCTETTSRDAEATDGTHVHRLDPDVRPDPKSFQP